MAARREEAPAAKRQDVVKVSGTAAGQRQAWRRRAAATGLSLSGWMREAADAAALDGVTAFELRSELVGLRTEARRLDNKLRHLVDALRSAEQEAEAGHPLPLQSALAEFATTQAELRRALDQVLRRVERPGQGRRR